MKTNKAVRLLSISLLALGVLSACVKTDELRPSSIVGAETDTMTFEAEQAEPQVLPVYSDGKWTMECDADWITLDKMEGNGNTDVTVSVADNFDENGVLDSPRETKLILKAGLELSGKGYTVTVKQVGNKNKGVKDITVTEALKLKDKRVAQIPTSTVVALATGAIVISDGASNIAVYGIPQTDVKIGDTVKLTGDKQSDYGIPSIVVDPELFEITATEGKVTYPAPKSLTDVDKYAGTTSEYLEVSGSLVGNSIRFADKEKNLDVILAPESFNLAALNLHKVVVKGYYAGVYDRNHAIILTEVTDGGYDESLAPYPVIWAIGDGAKAAGVLNYTTESFAAKNSLEPIKGFGALSYIPACDPPLDIFKAWDSEVEMKTVVDNKNDRFKRDISASNPRIQGTWPGDFWLFKGDGAIKAGSKVQIKFESRVSATNHKFWQLEFYDGDHWKVAGELLETDEPGSAITYTHQMTSDGSTNIKVNTTVAFNHNTENCLFRFRCMANWPANGQGALEARNGGTGRLSVTDTGEGGVEWWPSLTILEEGDGVDRPDTDPVMANIIVTPDYLAFEGNPAEAKKITVLSDYDFTIEPSVDWITLDVTSGLKDEKTVINVTCAESMLSTLREGKLVISSADSKRTVPVIQSAAGQELDPLISIDENHKSVSYKGQSVKVKVQSTVDYTVTPDVDWISLNPATKTVVNKDEVVLYLSENASTTETRSGHVVFANEEEGIETVLTIEQGTHPAAASIFEDDFSWLSPVIAAYNEKKPDNPTSDFIHGDYASISARIAYSNDNSFNLDSTVPDWPDMLAENGYVHLNPSTYAMYAQGTPEDPYLKFCKKNTQDGLSFQPFSESYETVTLSFDWALHMTNSALDVVNMQIVIEGEGEFANGTKESDPAASVQTAVETPVFTHSEFEIRNVGPSTVVKICCKEGFEANFAATGQHRYYIDNILITK